MSPLIVLPPKLKQWGPPPGAGCVSTGSVASEPEAPGGPGITGRSGLTVAPGDDQLSPRGQVRHPGLRSSGLTARSTPRTSNWALEDVPGKLVVEPDSRCHMPVGRRVGAVPIRRDSSTTGRATEGSPVPGETCHPTLTAVTSRGPWSDSRRSGGLFLEGFAKVSQRGDVSWTVWCGVHPAGHRATWCVGLEQIHAVYDERWGASEPVGNCCVVGVDDSNGEGGLRQTDVIECGSEQLRRVGCARAFRDHE